MIIVNTQYRFSEYFGKLITNYFIFTLTPDGIQVITRIYITPVFVRYIKELPATKKRHHIGIIDRKS